MFVYKKKMAIVIPSTLAMLEGLPVNKQTLPMLAKTLLSIQVPTTEYGMIELRDPKVTKLASEILKEITRKPMTEAEVVGGGGRKRLGGGQGFFTRSNISYGLKIAAIFFLMIAAWLTLLTLTHYGASYKQDLTLLDAFGKVSGMYYTDTYSALMIDVRFPIVALLGKASLNYKGIFQKVKQLAFASVQIEDNLSRAKDLPEAAAVMQQAVKTMVTETANELGQNTRRRVNRMTTAVSDFNPRKTYQAGAAYLRDRDRDANEFARDRFGLGGGIDTRSMYAAFSKKLYELDRDGKSIDIAADFETYYMQRKAAEEDVFASSSPRRNKDEFRKAAAKDRSRRLRDAERRGTITYKSMVRGGVMTGGGPIFDGLYYLVSGVFSAAAFVVGCSIKGMLALLAIVATLFGFYYVCAYFGKDYFLENWPNLCFLLKTAFGVPLGAIKKAYLDIKGLLQSESVAISVEMAAATAASADAAAKASGIGSFLFYYSKSVMGAFTGAVAAENVESNLMVESKVTNAMWLCHIGLTYVTRFRAILAGLCRYMKLGRTSDEKPVTRKEGFLDSPEGQAALAEIEAKNLAKVKAELESRFNDVISKATEKLEVSFTSKMEAAIEARMKSLAPDIQAKITVETLSNALADLRAQSNPNEAEIQKLQMALDFYVVKAATERIADRIPASIIESVINPIVTSSSGDPIQLSDLSPRILATVQEVDVPDT